MRPRLWYMVRINPISFSRDYGLWASRYKIHILDDESHLWEKQYLPDFSLEGKTVLDVGAGCGETADFFFKHKASRVIGIECNLGDVMCLLLNRNRYHWNLEIMWTLFSVRQLRLPFDLCKIDIEGGEVELLKLEELNFPIIIETHSREITDALRSRFGSLKEYKGSNEDTTIVSNCQSRS